MAFNDLKSVTRYSDALDKIFMQKSVTSFFKDNALRTKFIGAKTVIIPDIDFEGLVNYDRDNGFERGALKINEKEYVLRKDRARSIMIDREDMDETGIANLAGKVLGEYVRTKVVPECDAYVLSQLFECADSGEENKNSVEYVKGEELSQLTNAINNVRKVVGYDEELVAFVESDFYYALENLPEISKNIIISDFKKGDINLKVKSVNGVALIPVVPERMKSKYIFAGDDGSTVADGFKPADDAKLIRLIVCPKSGAHLVQKSEKMRVFSPDENINADAYKFDYRIYYDVFVKKSGEKAIQAVYSENNVE